DSSPATATATMTDSGGPSCMDGDQNGDETDVDCGGSCGMTCGTGQGCLVNDDCISNICDGGTCQADPECENLMKDDPETDVDCGGVCGPTCQVGQVCIDGGDCVSNYCNPDSMTCQVPACDDGIRNGDETDVDCGGSCGMTCDNGQGCIVDDDCISLICDGGVCQASDLCNNGMKDMEETDVDCGGVCGPTCEIDEGCLIDGDCVSDFCLQKGNTCQMPACDDGIRNGDETDVDCGGSCETKCQVGEVCLVPEDCMSMACGEGLCLAP
ncbi:MAG: hypothetical protein KC420_22235, partial [Myxococcales bacterium]|nr:hypothetical protein [Myxococcales bacterium]